LVSALDSRQKVVRLRLGNVGLDWCEGRLLTPQGPVTVKWWKDKNKVAYRADLPAGYTLRVENLTGSSLSAQ
jgi:alpha-L-rhamnosidase